MEQEVEKFLQILNSQRCLQKPKEASLILDKICQCFKQEQSQFNVSLLIGQVLNEKDDIFTFIWKMSSEAETISSVTAAFKLLELLVIDFQKLTEPYFVLIFQRCVNLLGTKFSKVKELSLKLLKQLLKLETRIVFDLVLLTSNLEKVLEDGKKSGLIVEQVYSIFGFLCDKHPESVNSKSRYIFDEFYGTLCHEITVAKTPSVSKVKGAFEGLNGYLTNYPPTHPDKVSKLYEFMKKYSKYQPEKRNVGVIVLKILKNHWTHFSKFVFEDREIWKENLGVWIDQGTEERQAAFSGYNGYYNIISVFVKQNPSRAPILEHFLKDFKEILLSSILNSHEKRSALVGMKLFVLNGCLQGDVFNENCDLILEFSKKQESLNSYMYFPLCIECISAFVLKSPSSDVSEQMSLLQRLSVNVINQYPKIDTDYQPFVLTALEMSFYMLCSYNLMLFETHLNKVLYQGLIRTCSVVTVDDVEALKEQDVDVNVVSYKSYLTLWEYLLNLSSTSHHPPGGSFTLKSGVSTKVTDAIILSLIKIISKLNLNVTLRKLELEVEMKIEKPSDLQIFINCVDLYQDLLPETQAFNLTKWLPEIFEGLIYFSEKYPLVAGFYKIIGTTLTVSDKVQFFEKENQNCFNLVSRFLESVVFKIDQYKGDLQVVCLQMLLSAPAPCIEPFVEKMIPVLEVVVVLGRTHFHLLKNLVETLERWYGSLSPVSAGIVMEQILPHFDVFFQSQYFQGSNLGNSSIVGKKLKKKLIFNDSELLSLQKKFLLFLGSIDVNLALNLLKKPPSGDRRKISDRQIFYNSPFGEGNAVLNLNDLLPRVMDLALSCSNRQTRIFACELLYSAIMIILSSINQLGCGYSYIFRKIIRTCVILGSDSDVVVFQIYEPLMFQITHYFSSKKAVNFPESQDVIDILMDTVTRPYNTAARDFAALLIREFTEWSIKQLTPEELVTTPKLILKILNSVYSLAVHPSYNKRLGAAIVFNKIYTVLREEEKILEKNWFQLYYYFMESLRMCDESEDMLEILEAVQHTKRPLVERKEEFNNPSDIRVVPVEFKGGLLRHLVEWTAELCCDLKKRTRRVAMSLVIELAPLVSACNSLKDFFDKMFPRHKTIISEKLLECSTFREDKYSLWLDYHGAVFEYCTWLFQRNIATVEIFHPTMFADLTKDFVSGITAEVQKNAEVERKMRESVMLFLNFILEMKRMLTYFSSEVYPFLRIVVFRPSQLGFDLAHHSTCEELESILVQLFKVFSLRLTRYDWNQFYENLECQISVPLLQTMTRNRTVSVSSWEYLFALKVICKSGLWNDFINRLMFSIDGTLIFEIVFRSLFKTQGKNLIAVLLEPPCKMYLEELMRIGVQVGVSLDDVINFMEDVESVTEEESGKLITKGEYFHFQFRKILVELFENQSEELVELVLNKGTEKCLNLLIRIFENETPGGGERISVRIFSRWSDFLKLQAKNCGLAEKRVLIKLGIAASSVLVRPGSLKETSIADVIFSDLKNISFQEMKTDELKLICNLLPFLTEFCERENDGQRLEEGLKELLSESNAFCCYVFEPSYESSLSLVFSALLRSLKLTGSLTILKVALTVVRWFERFSKQNEVELALSVFADLPVPHVAVALSITYRTILEQHNSLEVLRVYRWFMDPLINVAPSEAFIKFCIENLEEFCELLTTHWTDRSTKLRDFRIDLSKKIASASLLQVFIVRLPNAQYEVLPKERKDLFVKLVKNCFVFFKKPKPDDTGDTLKDLYHNFMCEAFKMICSIISSRCKDEKFYRLFVFPVEDSFLFEAISNTVEYNLEVDFDEIPKRKKIKTSIRNIPTPELSVTRSVKHMQSSTLFSSSLQEDVTKFDMSSASIRPLNSVENTDALEVDLEIDALNGHECMPTLVGVIMKLVSEKITPPPQSSEEIDQLPCWLKFFIDSLESTLLTENQQLFVLKAMYNVKDYVEPYSATVFPVVLGSVSNLFPNLNYFFFDLIEMMVSWKVVPASTELQEQLTKLILLIINKSYSLRRDIARNNLNVVKGMVDTWKDKLKTLDVQSFVLKQTDQEFPEATGEVDETNYINAKFCEILLSNGISPWLPRLEQSVFDYFVKNLNESNKNKVLFAEVCGLSLSHMENSCAEQSYERCEELLKEKILSQNVGWLQLLYGVHKHHPKIVSKFVFKIFSSAWDSTDAFAAEKLEMLLSYVSSEEATDDEVFNRHGHYFLIDMLNSADVLVQQLSLKITLNLVHKLENDKLKLLMREVFRLQKSAHSTVRKSVYEIAVKFYPKCEEMCDVSKKCKIVLLKGLDDDVKELEQICIDFWQSCLQSSTTHQMLLKVFREMYVPEVEDIFLSNAIKIIAHSTVTSNHFNKALSQHPIIHQSTFQKRSLVLKSRAATLSGYMSSRMSVNQSLEHLSSLSSQTSIYIRQTGSLKFEPTMKETAISFDSDSTVFKKPEVPKKRRFYKSAQKTSYSFARWQKHKKKKELEMEDEWWKQKNSEIDIYGEYRFGDYPDIEIAHSQIIKPLKALASRDNQVARLFLVSFFSGLVESLNMKGKREFLLEVNKVFETMLKTSTSFDPGVFGFVLEILLKQSDDLEVEVELVSNAAVSSNWLLLGTLIIERSIAKHEGHVVSEAKRRKGVKNLEKKRWLELAKLYRSLEEFDVLSGIFLDKLNVVGEERDAIYSETFLDWSSASKQYETILKKDGDSLYSEFYTESYFSCLAKLSNWSELNSCIRTTVEENWEELWKNFNLLSWFLKSEMMISLGGENNNFRSLMDDFCKDKPKLSVLSSNFVEELAVFDWVSEKFQKASYRIDRMCLDFLVGWSHLNQWCYNLRAAKLMDLQTAAELNFAVETLSEHSKPALEEEIKLGCKNWKKNLPTQRDDLIVWDIKLRYRQEYLRRLKNFNLKIANAESNLALAKASLLQKNLSLAKDCLSRVKEILPEVGSELKADFNYCFNLGKMVVADSKMSEGVKGLEMYLSVWKGISNELSLAMDTDSDDSKIHSFRSHFILADIITAILPVATQSKNQSGILKVISSKTNITDNVIEGLKSKGLEYLGNARDIAETLNCCSSKSDVYLQLSKFLIKFTEIITPQDFERFSTYILKSMALGDVEARQLFGHILSTSESITVHMSLNTLIVESQGVPSWMFLIWINQILANLETNLFPLLKSIILRVAKDYPNAVRYPFRLSKERYKRENAEMPYLVAVLEGMLFSNPLYEQFFHSMHFLGPPDLIIKYHLDKVLKETEKPSPRSNVINALLEDIQKLMFSNDLKIFRGSVFSVWDAFHNPVKTLISNKENKDFLKREIKTILNPKTFFKWKPKKVLNPLDSFCPWLKNFHAMKETTALELPGQYDGNRKPIQQYLVTITSFKNEVVVLQSKNKPVRITILGNDAKEHKFLIKFGEDLRQDERLQQLFGHLNYKLRENRQTKRFSIDRFKVVPLTDRLGMIQWIDNNASLHEIIKEALGNKSDLISKAQNEHIKFLAQGANPDISLVEAHLKAFDFLKRETAVAGFHTRVYAFPQGLLRKAFWNLSNSPENFVFLRENFAVSHAVMSIAHWVVGVGDRHLQNILVSTKTGRVLGIDFGYAFGFATQFLNPPELVPFRLTPQILGLLHPLKESGWIKQTMIHCMRLFRKEKFMIMSVLEVFVKEPLLDWLEQSRGNTRYKAVDSDVWYPKQKISMVEKKIDGCNPVTVCELDLREGHKMSKHLPKFLEVLKGLEQHNVRARYGADGLLVENQVECLIDLATDSHVLCKTYVGWNAWL